ncbi:hypothetical protein V1288_001151 [Bradyrhizobium sp. AZCC 2176]
MDIGTGPEKATDIGILAAIHSLLSLQERPKDEPGIHFSVSYAAQWIPGSRSARPQVRNCAPGNDKTA